jgi:hypothetical protein
MAARFPLVPRGRPAARSLAARIDEVRRLATEQASEEGQAGLARVTQALNKAALIASDCGLVDLAHELCWRQFEVLHAAAPLPATAAQYALEPIINLGRLATRRGDGAAAYQIYQDTLHAVTAATSASIDGRHVDFGNLVGNPEDRQQLCQFLWAVLLADGTRALITSSRWNDVLAHVQRYNGIGDRMLDGRQAAVLSHTVCGRTELALAVIDSTATQEPWERAVVACLRTLCLRFAGRTSDDTVTAMIDEFQAVQPKPEAVVFYTRLGLCVVDLAEVVRSAACEEVMANLVQLAVEAGDARAADMIIRRGCPERSMQSLTNIIESSGLKQRSMAPGLSDSLAAAAEHALTTLAGVLAVQGHASH